MARIRLEFRRDADGQAHAVFSKGSGSFSIGVSGVRPDDDRWVRSDVAGDRRGALVRRTTLAEYCNRRSVPP